MFNYLFLFHFYLGYLHYYVRGWQLLKVNQDPGLSLGDLYRNYRLDVGFYKFYFHEKR